MTLDEVFPNPTVKVVIFQARFPRLFYLEDKMGAFQIELIDKYPDSRLLIQKKMFLASVMPEAKLEDAVNSSEGAQNKIWEFQSENRVKVNVSEDSVSLTSEFHKTYMNEGADVRFRDEIQYVVEKFLKTFPIPKFTRVGLRYIDECPVPSRTNEGYLEYYNSGLPLDRFDLADIDELQVRAVVNRGDFKLRYFERFDLSKGGDKVTMDFDAFAVDVRTEELIAVTDGLHEIASKEFEDTVKAPLLERMRSEPEEI